MMLISPPSDHDLERGLPQMIGAGGYANPPVPVQVTLARDEEAAGIESDATKTPPPAYGLWRESVVRGFQNDLRANLLTTPRGSTRTVSIGSETKQQQLDTSVLLADRTLDLQQPDHHLISLKMESIMSSRLNQGQ